MRKILPLFLLSLISSVSYGQKHKHKKAEADTAPPPPRVWLANIHTYYGSRDSVLAKPMLSTDSAGCRPSGFTISLSAPGHDFYGPLYSNTWEMTQPQKDAIKRWDYPNSTLYIQDIHLNCHEKDATAPPFQILLTQ